MDSGGGRNLKFNKIEKWNPNSVSKGFPFLLPDFPYYLFIMIPKEPMRKGGVR